MKKQNAAEDDGSTETELSDAVDNMYVFEGKDYSKELLDADTGALKQLVDGKLKV